MENAWLIVGLGNPGRTYAGTRHNAGFMVVEALARRWGADWGENRDREVRLARCDREGKRVLLCQPETYMNASGVAVRWVTSFYHIACERMVVVVDDADLPLGEIRLRGQGSSGGHHGLESIEHHLGRNDFPRLRVGIGRRDDDRREIAGYVLAPFGRDEEPLRDRVVERACRQIECWLSEGLAKAMSQFNGRIENENNESQS